MKSIPSRIKEVTVFLGITVRQMERDINASNGTIQKAIQADKDISSSWIQAIVNHYNIDATWLLTGAGDMRRKVVSEPLKVYAKGGEKNLQLLTAPTEIYINLDASGNKPIPIIDIQAAAGYPGEIGNPVFLQQCPVVSISWPQFKNGEHIMLQIKGNSMEDTIYHGDWVICRRLFNPVQEIKDGYIHVVVTGNREGGEVVCKRVLNRLSTKKYLVMQSDNPEFTTYTEPAENILQVWKVEFKMSAILKNKSTDLYKRVNNLEAEILDIKQMLKK